MSWNRAEKKICLPRAGLANPLSQAWKRCVVSFSLVFTVNMQGQTAINYFLLYLLFSSGFFKTTVSTLIIRIGPRFCKVYHSGRTGIWCQWLCVCCYQLRSVLPHPQTEIIYSSIYKTATGLHWQNMIAKYMMGVLVSVCTSFQHEKMQVTTLNSLSSGTITKENKVSYKEMFVDVFQWSW